MDNNNNTQLHHLIKKPKAHRLIDYGKLILEQKNDSNNISVHKKSIYPHSDNDDDEDEDDEHPGSVSDCDGSGKKNSFNPIGIYSCRLS